MAQHDMNIANQGFPATRADLNNALQALVSNSSGTSAPTTTFANQWWYDTTNNKMYIRNEANNAWIEVFTLDQTNNEWQLTTGVVQAKDGDGLALNTDDGTTRIFIKDSDGSVAIGHTSPDAQLHVKGSDTTDQIIIENTDASSGSAPDLVFYRNSASPADNDLLARLEFQGNDSAGNAMDYGLIIAKADNVTNGSENGSLKFYVAHAGEVAGVTDTEAFTIVSPQSIRQNLSADTSDDSQFVIVGGTSGSSQVLFGDTSDLDVGRIRYLHSSNSMEFRVNADTAMTITDDGHVKKHNNPSFMVFGNPTRDTSGTYNEVLRNFGTVNHNNGSHYNNSTGRFTAPANGKYMFTAMMISDATSSIGNLLYLRKNGSQVVAANIQKFQATVTSIIDLNQNDYVDVQADVAPYSSTPRNSFCGTLIG